MITQLLSRYDIVSQLPEDAIVIWHHVSWEEYERLLDEVGEAPGLRISFDDGTLQVMSISPEHEKYAEFIKSMVSAIRLRLRINILFFGSATMKKRKESKGNEPDACFYVQTAAVVGNKIQLDFETDPPPDIAVEVDVHHDSRSKFPIYAGLGVPEIWRYDGQQVTIYLLHQDNYVITEMSQALPMLSSRVLTEFLARMRQEGEFEAILAFDQWLQSQSSPSTHP
jgi:Uma2 family endonuclease